MAIIASLIGCCCVDWMWLCMWSTWHVRDCSVAVSLLYSSLTSLVCKLQEGRIFCMFWSLLDPQSPQQCSAHSRCSINEWMILYEPAQHTINTRWLNIMVNLLNWIVVLIRAIIVPQAIPLPLIVTTYEDPIVGMIMSTTANQLSIGCALGAIQFPSVSHSLGRHM